MTKPVTIQLSDADIATLQEWAGNAETTVEVLLQQAVRNFIKDMRADQADLEERMKGPFHSLDEVRAYLAERRRRRYQQQVEAAE